MSTFSVRLGFRGQEIVAGAYTKSRPQEQIVTEHASLTDLSLCRSFLVYEHACKTVLPGLPLERPPNADYLQCMKVAFTVNKQSITTIMMMLMMTTTSV